MRHTRARTVSVYIMNINYKCKVNDSMKFSLRDRFVDLILKTRMRDLRTLWVLTYLENNVYEFSHQDSES